MVEAERGALLAVGGALLAVGGALLAVGGASPVSAAHMSRGFREALQEETSPLSISPLIY